MAFGYEEELRAEIARLRDALDEQTGRAEWNYECVTRCEGKVIQRDAEIARLRLTDAERDLVERLAAAPGEPVAAMEVRLTPQERKTARGLLDRTGDER